MFDSIYLAAYSIYMFNQIYPMNSNLATGTRCSSSIYEHIPYRLGYNLIEYIKKTVFKTKKILIKIIFFLDTFWFDRRFESSCKFCYKKFFISN